LGLFPRIVPVREMNMKIINQFFQRLLYYVTLPIVFTHAIFSAFQRGPKQAAENKNEIERLDRLRNPSKYRGV
jgi:Na+/H+-dicarboxylate symporter